MKHDGNIGQLCSVLHRVKRQRHSETPVGAWPNVQRRCFGDGGVGNVQSDPPTDGVKAPGSQVKHSTTQLL